MLMKFIQAQQLVILVHNHAINYSLVVKVVKMESLSNYRIFEDKLSIFQ
jgi:hypothetical protein